MTPIQLPVLLLTGYLGSGKTTLLNRILSNKKGIKFAVIVNDIGEVNIDADLISKEGIVNTGDDSLVPLQNGCICCTLKADLAKQVADLAESGKFDYLVIEASGICEPEPIAQAICAMPQVRLDCIATVVDALRMRDEFQSGEALTRSNIDEEDIENLVIQQIEFCNAIVLNKISEISAADADKLKAVIRAIQPSARILECDWCDVPLDDIINTSAFDFEKVATSATWVRELEKQDSEDTHSHHDSDSRRDDHGSGHHHDHHDQHHQHHQHHDEGEAEEYGIGTFVYFARKPFSLNKFDYFCARYWPDSVIRTKGVCYFVENPDMSYLFEQAGRQKRLIPAGQWYATAPEEDLEILLAREPGLMNDWDPVYGDRMDKIVFIGRNMDRAAITAALDAIIDADWKPADK